MAQALQAEGLNGAVWASVSSAATATGAAGIKNAATGEPMQPATRMHVGSVTKSVLAAGVLRLVTSGRLTLDTPVAALLPGLAFDNRWHAGAPVRVRHLLAHTSGLDNARLRHVFSLAPRADTPLAAAFAGDPALLRVHTRPGSQYAYSNTGYALLGMVIESVTGGRYEEYLDTELLRPLSMHDSSFRFATQSGPQADARLAMGHFERGATQAAVSGYLRRLCRFPDGRRQAGRPALHRARPAGRAGAARRHRVRAGGPWRRPRAGAGRARPPRRRRRLPSGHLGRFPRDAVPVPAARQGVFCGHQYR
jgi:CubicO group peptidase (beta-lactamase class C family)